MLTQALIECQGDADRLAAALARRLRWWLLRVPAGIGFGTLRACLKLWMGISPTRSGVFSAGNGPAMRSALLGIVSEDRTKVDQLVTASTRITHTDPRAEQGALVAATASWLVSHQHDVDSMDLIDELSTIVDDPELKQAIQSITPAIDRGDNARTFADSLGLNRGVSGYVNHTVPAAVFCWLRHRNDFRAAVESAVELGGDTDTVGAITGAMAGAELGTDAIPEAWLDRLAEWPCTVKWMSTLSDHLAESLTSHRQVMADQVPVSALLVRNVVFTCIVLTHGLRRLLPPY